MSRRFELIGDFFEAVRYRDFSRVYYIKHRSKDLQKLYSGFNLVNQTIRDINNDKEVQYLYLQKILEMIEVGILAYELGTGKVLWVNGAFQHVLDLPQFKNISFVKRRDPVLYELLFNSYYKEPATLDFRIKTKNLKVLLSNSTFNIKTSSYKLIVIQNIEDTVNKTESEAWKKLLSVMTHEIMNSIAPISSLANTLKSSVKNIENKSISKLAIEDLDAGLNSIAKRSEGLMKFAKTYRSLNKVNSINKEDINLKKLFRDIEQLMREETFDLNMLKFQVKDPLLKIKADSYLLEQILINLILNAVEACEEVANPEIKVTASKNSYGKVVVEVIDNGPGIPKEIKDQVFVPFFTTKKKGSGIGLSLSRQIMTLHGGKIQIDNFKGKGAHVTLEF